VAVLKQAAGLAMKEQTTVRIPIPVAGESESFGVYAVPGLETHVFVGPFTSKDAAVRRDSAELICLDDDDVTEVKENQPVKPDGGADDDDDIQEIFPAENAAAGHDGFVKFGEIPAGPMPPAKSDTRKLAIGQVPLVVSKTHEEHRDVEVIDLEDEDTAEDGPDTERKCIPQSEFGRTVFRQHKNQLFEDKSRLLALEFPGFGELSVHVRPDRITFRHPKHPNHEVVCSSLDNAHAWMNEFLARKARREGGGDGDVVENPAGKGKPEVPKVCEPGPQQVSISRISVSAQICFRTNIYRRIMDIRTSFFDDGQNYSRKRVLKTHPPITKAIRVFNIL
jgi:hypothetical protein